MRAPKNLTIVVWDNGLYQITGGQPTASASTADLVAIARALGTRQQSLGRRTKRSSRGWSPTALAEGGPSLIAARIDDKPGVGTTDRDPVQIRAALHARPGREAPKLTPLKRGRSTPL